MSGPKAPSATDERIAERLRLNLTTEGMVEAGSTVSVLVHNLSATGMLVEMGLDLPLGQSVTISLPESSAVAATIVWRSDTLYGCRFDDPLSQAVLSAAQLRNPLPSDLASPTLIGASEEREPLAARLRRLREERGLSLAGLATLAGLSKPSIWAWETGKTAPRIKSLQAVAAALGVTDEELYMGRGAAESPAPFAAGDASAVGQNHLLRELVESSKLRIASAAGVEARRVRITIDL
ncbi:helix-turn-helix domain-containing protein [Sphingopyxis sp. MWB1]|uniref:helix-turn-helix domain-containing protein n=1 Tax=Sphingopyxis sp. MWB1 TaxID=1537715 RepID=UPI00051A6355|nr:helix-turn-helix domain-containing protein [Sphingopyxis sp. MWB1]